MTYDETRKYYVYVWYVKQTKRVFYIGKGCGNRYKVRKRENPYFMNMLKAHECESAIISDNLTEKEAFDFEKHLISLYRDNDYKITNIADGGENPPKLIGIPKTEEQKRKMAESNKRFHEEHPEVAKAQSEKMKAFFKTEKGKEFQRKSIEARNNDEFRKRQSEICRKANNTKEYLERHSQIIKDMWKSEEYAEAHKGKNNHRAQSVKQFDLDGNFIKEYDTLTQASEETGASISKISAVCKGRRKTTGGYVWEFSNDKHIVLKRENKYDPSKDKNAKPIIQYTKTGEFVKEYYSINEAVRQNPGMDRSGIQQCLRGKTKSAYGYVWEFK